jgi:hypothetical protein
MSIEIIAPETGLWKADPEVAKQQAKTRLRRRRRWFVLVAVVFLASGSAIVYQLAQNEDPHSTATSDPGSAMRAPMFSAPPTTNTESGGDLSGNATPPVTSSVPNLKDTSVRLAPPSKLSPSVYSSTLDSIELLLEQGNLREAEAKFKALPPEALGHPNALHVARLIDQARRNIGERRLIYRDSSHFQVKFDGGEDYEIWGRVLEILEDAYRDIGQQLGYYPAKPIVVVLITKETFHGASKGPAWSDGLFDPFAGRIKIPTQGALTDQAWLTRVLRHEYVHALLHDRVGGRVGAIPTWLNEGLAMQLAGDAPPDISDFARGDVQLVPLTFLEGPWGGFSQKLATVAYLEGNSATVYLIDRFSMEKVRELLTVLAAGQPIATAMQDRLFFPYDEFQRRWIDHLNDKLKKGKT